MKTIGAFIALFLAFGAASAETIEVSTQQIVQEVNTESASISGANGGALQTRRPGNLPTSMTFEVYAPKAGKYNFGIDYAIHVPRPVTVTVNGRIFSANAAAAPTGGYTDAFRVVSREGVVLLKEGKNTITLSRGGDIPHIFGIVLEG